jgi:hypothetical protein
MLNATVKLSKKEATLYLFLFFLVGSLLALELYFIASECNSSHFFKTLYGLLDKNLAEGIHEFNNNFFSILLPDVLQLEYPFSGGGVLPLVMIFSWYDTRTVGVLYL